MSTEKIMAQVDGILGRMNLEEKLGQCFTFSFAGSTIRPRHIRAITKLHCGGFRLTPTVEHGYGTHNIQRLAHYLLPGDYAELMNQLQRIAADRRHSIPLIISADQEGDFSNTVSRGDVGLLPNCMGLASVEEPDFIYRAHRVMARQLRAHGINMIHSPVLDININPKNPEIGPRSYGDTPEAVAEGALQSLRAFRETGLISTAKHFPGRGDSDQDAHFSLVTLPFDRKRFEEVEFYPYRKLIPAGLDAIMPAHMRAPALDPSGEPATTSERMVQEVIRGQLGFEGVITSDSMAMLGIRELYGIPDACARAIRAGIDLILMKVEGDLVQECYDAAMGYVKSGKITEARLDEAVRRILKLKLEKGLFDQNRYADPSQAEGICASAETKAMVAEAARKCLTILRDDRKRIPIRGVKPEEVLVIDQIHEFQTLYTSNDKWHHPGYFSECVAKRLPEAEFMEIEGDVSAAKVQEAVAKAGKAKLVLMTDFGTFKSKTAYKVVRPLVEAGKDVIIVTSTPYSPCSLPDGPSFVLTYSAAEESLAPAVDLLFGIGEAPGRVKIQADLTQKFQRVDYGSEMDRKYLTGVKSGTATKVPANR